MSIGSVAPPPRRRGDAARAALVEHAERLFAERGIETVSLRDVSAAAGQRNHSAAQYHFGDRQGLLAAVYEARMRLVDERRHAYVDALRRAGRIDEVRGLVEAVVLPLVEVVDETGGWYARFLARTRWDPFAWDVLVSLPTSSSFQTVLGGLDRQLRELRAAVRRQRLDQMLTLVIGTLAGWEGAPDRGERRLARETFSAELVTTASALLTARSESLRPATSSLTGART
jgi:AcrR family transcriptional regulator